MEDNHNRDNNGRPVRRRPEQTENRRVQQQGTTGARRTQPQGSTGTTRRTQSQGTTETARRTSQEGTAGTTRRVQPQGTTGTTRRTQQSATRRTNSMTGKNPKKPVKNTKQAVQKKRRKIVLFITEIFLLLILLVVFWGVMQAQKIKIVTIDDAEVEINEQVKESTENGVLKGYRNIALFGVDSRDGELDKNTRTDTIKVVSINLDTKDVKMISVYRDTYLNLSTDTYNKANAAYARGGPQQAISMLNMNMDLNITDFVTIGFDGLIDVIDAVGGVEIDVQSIEIDHLNSYQISMVGKQDGTFNAKGEPNYVADAGVDYIPVTKSGLQTLNGLQATAYCRIRYVGNDFARAERQNAVLKQVAKKAMTLNPTTLNKIAEAVFSKVVTSLELNEILELLSGIASYKIGETAGFPFDGNYQTGMVGKMSCVIPQDLEHNVTLLHEFLFEEASYEPSETVKTCSKKIASDTGIYYSGQ